MREMDAGRSGGQVAVPDHLLPSRPDDSVGASITGAFLAGRGVVAAMSAVDRMAKQFATFQSPAMESALKSIAGPQGALAKQFATFQSPAMESALKAATDSIRSMQHPAIEQIFREVASSIAHTPMQDPIRQATGDPEHKVLTPRAELCVASSDELFSWFVATLVFLYLLGHWLQYVSETETDLTSLNADLFVTLPDVGFMVGVSKGSQIATLRILRWLQEVRR